jgi:UDP-glucose 4-epimerase
VAQVLLAEPELRVLGIDARPPERVDPGLDFVKADIRNPLLLDLMRAERVDTLVHLAWRERQWRCDADFESNVLGSMQLIGAAVDAGVSQVVLKSTMAVYGAVSDNPMALPESAPLRAHSRYANVRDALDLELSLSEFAAEYPELRLAVLRFPSIVGPDVDTPFTRWLRRPVMPELLGFDPLFQVIDADDVVDALVHAARTEASGPFNVAADGVVSACQVAGMVGKPLVPIWHLLTYWGSTVLAATPGGRRALAWLPIEPDYLRYPWTGSLARMWTELSFEPRLDARQAIERTMQAWRIQPFVNTAEHRRFADDHLDTILAERRTRNRPAGDAPGV